MASLPSMATLLKASTIPCGLLIILLLNSSCNAENILYSGDTLQQGNFLAYGYNYRFIMQSDCNLVLYEDEKSVWASGTSGWAQNCSCTLQPDGNLVVKAPSGDLIWDSKSAREEGYYVLVLQGDRNVAIYGPNVWSTNTYKAPTAAAVK